MTLNRLLATLLLLLTHCCVIPSNAFSPCVAIGANTVVHPSAKLLALGGPIVVGESNLLKDSATIVNPLVYGAGHIASDTLRS